MTWTATLTQLGRVRDEWRFSILYTNTISGDTFPKHYRQPSLTKRALRDLVRNEVTALANNETTDVDIPIGTTIDVTPEPVVQPDPPTQAQLDKQAWFTDWRKLNQMIAVTVAIPTLATAQTNTAITNLQTSLAADWKTSYVGNI